MRNLMRSFDNHEDFQTSKSVDDFPVRAQEAWRTSIKACGETQKSQGDRSEMGFQNKTQSDGSICKHKARLVVKGYAQQYGVDYQETFALVARDICRATRWGCGSRQRGLCVPSKEDIVWLETSPQGLLLIVSLYVDDMLVTGNQPKLIQSFKDEMNKVFEMTDLGVMKPDILFAVSVLSRFMHSPKGGLKLLGYSDSDWGGCVDDSRIKVWWQHHGIEEATWNLRKKCDDTIRQLFYEF
ncbi:hypothetical protein CK203_067681 [Vitis vinifera]|uniref:Reverse transcriptase Ty1/copia-type domain-containing protein n=1 Tax=Vitis vinifera TaxID=29760 RepID=A0A438EC58_VITVI|nr:hypothetical protein CK203_067681 [Vitis vinifera]